MLSYLLGLIQEFERIHGQIPVLVCLNTRHMDYLLEECPDLVRDDEPFPFGFRISVLPEDELAHPVVSVLPVTRCAGGGSRILPQGRGLPAVSRRESAATILMRRAYHR